MTLPNYSGKHDAPSVFTAEERLNVDSEEVPAVPSAVVICYQDRFFDHLVETYTDGEPLLAVGTDQMYRITADVGVVGGFGVGSAVTAALVEETAALGVNTFCILGGAGCLDPDIPPDEAVLATRAIRDEGASYHYVAPDAPVEPTHGLVDDLATAIHDSETPVHRGPTWTIDAFYRETVPEVEHYASEGVLTAEMEAATLFAVADFHGLNAAAVFSIGDYVTTDEREVPSESHSLLPELFDPTVDALETYIQ